MCGRCLKPMVKSNVNLKHLKTLLKAKEMMEVANSFGVIWRCCCCRLLFLLQLNIDKVIAGAGCLALTANSICFFNVKVFSLVFGNTLSGLVCVNGLGYPFCTPLNLIFILC